MVHSHANWNMNKFPQGGPLRLINGAITTITGHITPVTHLFSAIDKGYNSIYTWFVGSTFSCWVRASLDKSPKRQKRRSGRKRKTFKQLGLGALEWLDPLLMRRCHGGNRVSSVGPVGDLTPDFPGRKNWKIWTCVFSWGFYRHGNFRAVWKSGMLMDCSF